MSQTGKSTPAFGWQHATVVLVGLLVFVLLLFADKTNLTDDESGQIDQSGESSSEPAAGGDAPQMLSLISPANPSEELSKLESDWKAASSAEARDELLKQIVSGYRESGRLDVAAVYAGELAAQDPSPKNLLVAGALFRNANRMPSMGADSIAFRAFSDEAIRLLEQAEAQSPDAEDVKIELGLALVESRKPGSSMQGIFKIREVAEANPKNTEALFHLGGFSLDTGQWDKAEGRFRQILVEEPANVRAKYYLGVALDQQGKSAEFQKLMTEVAEQQQDPELAAAAKAALNK